MLILNFLLPLQIDDSVVLLCLLLIYLLLLLCLLPCIIFLGVTAQLFACINDFKYNNIFGIAEHDSHQFAAYSELLVAIVSFYGSAAVLNPHFVRVFLPVGIF
jgi:succinate-acetate transporter protein